MDCDHCEPVLLDLCYGELEPAQEREVRAHVHECPACRKALSRIEAGQALARHLPDEAPSPEMTDRILRAAQSHLRKRGTAFERFQGFLESMARIAMTRQVAMATMSLLIVFVGLWSLPELTHRRQERGALVVETPHDGEAGPSAVQPTAAAPQQPATEPAPEPVAVAERVEPRKRAAADEADRPPLRRAEESASKRIGAGPRESAAANAVAARQQKAKEERKGDRFAPPPPAAAAAPAESLDDLLANDRALGDRAAKLESAYGTGSGSGRVAAKAPSSSAETADVAAAAAPVEAESLERLARERLRAAPRSAAAPGTQAQAARAPSTLEDVYAAGVERYRANDYAAAANLFSQMLESSSPSAQRPAALLYLARSERALGRCDRAIRAYETLVRSYGSAQQSGSALSEGVACFDQLGDKAGAHRFLEHASSVPSLSAQATKALHERAAGKPADSPAVGTPAARP